MNLILSFVHTTKPARTIGPFDSVRLDAESVRESFKETLVAYHRDHQWEVDGQRYFRLDATGSVRIHFERNPTHFKAIPKSRSFGPFAKLSSVDGIAYTDDRVFAFVDQRVGDWFCYDDGRHWSIMVVNDASASGKTLLASLAALAPLLPGVAGLWQDTKLLYLGRPASIRARLEQFLQRNEARSGAG